MSDGDIYIDLGEEQTPIEIDLGTEESAIEFDITTPVAVNYWGTVSGTLSNQTDLQAALDLKATVVDLNSHINDLTNPHEVTKTQVGLSNVDNTSDLDKPISTATQSALDLKYDSADFNTDFDTRLGTKDITDLGTYSHTSLTDIGSNTHPQIDTHISNTNNPHSVTKTQVGLSNVDNIQQASKVNFDLHTGDGTIHFTQEDISITESQISDLKEYALNSDLSAYWKSNGSSTATGNWNLGNNIIQSKTFAGGLSLPYESSINTATMVNSVVVANNSFYFDGTAGTINPGNVINIQPTDSFTTNIWVKRNDDQDIGMVLQTNNLATNRVGIRLGRNDAINIFHRRNGASATTSIDSAINVFPTDGNYYLITMIKTPTSLTGFVNGVEVVSTTLTNNWDFSNTRPWTIGQRGDGVNFNQFTGNMKTITIYNRELSEQELLAIVQAGENSYTPITNSLIRQFHPDSTSSTTILDLKPITTKDVIPFVGATQDVNLGTNNMTTTGIATIGSIRTNIIYPSADSTTAVQIRKADGTTSILNVDTTNNRVGIGTTTPSEKLDVIGDIEVSADIHNFADNGKHFFGAGDDASISYDGTNIVINPKEVGTGYVDVLGDITCIDNRTINSGSITRSSGLITSINIGTRTITVNRDVDDVITGWEDSEYEWSVTRDVDGNIESWATVEK